MWARFHSASLSLEMADTKIAQKQWEAENKVQAMSEEELYNFDVPAYEKLIGSRPWAQK